MIRTRTIREAAAYFKETDPDTCLTETAIRTLLRTGAVPSARIGKKYLVAIEAFAGAPAPHRNGSKRAFFRMYRILQILSTR